MTTETPKTATVDHRGRRLQVHVAPWGDAGALHLHVQDIAGGAGRIRQLTREEDGSYSDDLVRELAGEHDDIAGLLGHDGDQEHDDVDARGWPQA